MADDSNTKVKVVDRRWFTADGDIKEVRAPESPSVPPPVPENGSLNVEPNDRDDHDAGTGKGPSAVGFLDLVDFLAQQAAALLSGQIPGRGRDPEMARFFIDLLGVVKDKSAGQVSNEEASYIEDVLYQLRSLFVAATR
ncbi:MAG: DUF1844 domain-containing protein [Acidobacteriia bacterium]|nr:DUF1844 domain-containing protein [Terriglobia bacterium]